MTNSVPRLADVSMFGKIRKIYYCFGQYTRYIRPGMTMLKSSGNTMAAFDDKNDQLVIVSYNTSASKSDMVYNLSQFAQNMPCTSIVSVFGFIISVIHYF